MDGFLEKGVQTGWWGSQNELLCAQIWWCGTSRFLITSVIGTCFWVALFAFFALVLYPLVEKQLDRIPSKVDGESGGGWFALHLQSTIHATLIVCITLGTTRALANSSIEAKYMAPQPQTPGDVSTVAHGAVIGNAAHVFLCYTLADTVTGLFRKSLTMDMVIHHLVFFMFCSIIMFDGNSPYLAGCLLQMELSTIFLNFFLFFRNRLGYEHPFVQLHFLLFYFAFIGARLVLGCHIVHDYGKAVYYGPAHLFAGIARWHQDVLFVGLLLAVSLQVVWGFKITRTFLKSLMSILALTWARLTSGGASESFTSKEE
mmetsp:Transcript_73492/g.132372  ORF Transcript_73492/g.132372 Transcript_73492/m.132372 type:complete len:315 (-) Transcript_73492:62-1006(-)